MEKVFAVLTGDLVKSSRLSGEMSNRAMDLVKNGASEFAEVHPGSVIGKIDTFRFDSWQLLLGKPELALYAAVFLRSFLKMETTPDSKLDTRVSIGIGSAESIDEEKISNSSGPAFTASGKALDAMGNKTLSLAIDGDPGNPWKNLENGIVPLLDCVVSDWTAPESRAVYGALWGWTQEETAKKWPSFDIQTKQITRQSVSKSLARAHWGQVESTLQWVQLEILNTL